VAVAAATALPAVLVASPASAATAARTDKPSVATGSLSQATAVGGMVQFNSAVGRIPGVILVGGRPGGLLPTMSGNGDFNDGGAGNDSTERFSDYSRVPGVKVITGDYNHDFLTDVALAPPAGVSWTEIPVALANGDGTFRTSFSQNADFAGWAAVAGARAVSGDFNHDGNTDIGLVGGAGQSTVPIAFSNGNGTFRVTNAKVSKFPSFAAASGVKVLAADFNNDGNTDIALTGGAGWSTVPIAFSKGDGTFNVTSGAVSGGFGDLATAPGAKALTGDFNHDGKTDIALTGGPDWTTVPLALSVGNGTWVVTLNAVGDFGGWAATPGVQAVAVDLNYDNFADIALTGGAGWTTIPVAFSTANGTFDVTNKSAPSFAAHAAEPGVTVIGESSELLLVGGTGWTVMPRAYGLGDGSWDVYDLPAATFARLAAPFPTVGQRRALVLRVTWAGADSSGADGLDDAITGGVDTWMRAASRGVFNGWSVTDPGLITIPQPAPSPGSNPCDNTFLHYMEVSTEQVASARGFNVSDFDVAVYWFPYESFCHWAGIGDLGGLRVHLNGDIGQRTLVHELGHHLGLGHGHSLACVDSNGNAVTLSSTCTTLEYGDYPNEMGNGTGTYSAPQLASLGWLNGSVADVPLAGGDYYLSPLDTQAGSTTARALRITDGSNILWVEYRRSGVLAHDQGVFVHLQRPDGLVAAGSFLVGVSQPLSIGGGPANLPVGASWTNPLGNMRITVVSEDASFAHIRVSTTLPTEFTGEGTGFKPTTALSNAQADAQWQATAAGFSQCVLGDSDVFFDSDINAYSATATIGCTS
jgi:FG-GAP-like repeat/Gametolysin peptidase M11